MLPEISVSEFVESLNDTLAYTYPEVLITGELANLRVSRNKFIYFDLKDEAASVKFFGLVYQLPGPLEDGMILKVRGQPRLHQLYGFSVNVSHIQPAGEGAIRRAAELLQVKLVAEGLFDQSRKRPLPYPPERIGLITARQSAAYADFTKILDARWGGVTVDYIDVLVQGESAPEQIVAAIGRLNALAQPPDVLVLVRGGGSAEDLAAWSTEPVTRAVAGSRIPTLVAIGHEVDVSLAELAADRRASTPSNAAELLVPDRLTALQGLRTQQETLAYLIGERLDDARQRLKAGREDLAGGLDRRMQHETDYLAVRRQLLQALSPQAILRRGYAIVRQDGTAVRSRNEVAENAIVDIMFHNDEIRAKIIGDDRGTEA